MACHRAETSKKKNGNVCEVGEDIYKVEVLRVYTEDKDLKKK